MSLKAKKNKKTSSSGYLDVVGRLNAQSGANQQPQLMKLFVIDININAFHMTL